MAEVFGNGLITWPDREGSALYFNLVGTGSFDGSVITVSVNGKFVGERKVGIRRGLVENIFLALNPPNPGVLGEDFMVLWGGFEQNQVVTIDFDIRHGIRRQQERFWAKLQQPHTGTYQQQLMIQDVSRAEGFRDS